MRGDDRQTGWMFSYVSPEERVPPDHPLRAIRRMTDAILDRLSPRFDRLYSSIGRPSIPPEKLLRALLLRGLHAWKLLWRSATACCGFRLPLRSQPLNRVRVYSIDRRKPR